MRYRDNDSKISMILDELDKEVCYNTKNFK